MNHLDVDLDYFGVASAEALRALQRKDGDRRNRKTAFGTLVHLAKLARLVAKNESVETIGFVVDKAGQLKLRFSLLEAEDKPKEVAALQAQVSKPPEPKFKVGDLVDVPGGRRKKILSCDWSSVFLAYVYSTEEAGLWVEQALELAQAEEAAS